MTTCATCNTQNLDGSQHCDACGASLAAPVDVSASLGTAETGGGTGNGGFAKGAAAQVKAESSSLATALSGASSHAVSVVDAPHATLVIERGRSAGKKFPLTEDESQIGRWDADGGIFPEIDLDADDPEAKVSRRHARITRRGNEYSVEDLGSTNGTFINRGRRLLPGDRHPLRDGDEIIVGKTFLRFHLAK